MNHNRYETGLEIVKELVGEKGMAETIGKVQQFYPDFAKIIIEFGFGDIYSRPGLDLKQRELLAISSLVNQGAEAQLPFHIHGALNVGLSPTEIVEAVLHCAPYAGFPKAIIALGVVMKIFEERKVKPV